MEPNKELEKAIESKFLTPTKFSMEIEKIVAEEKLNYIDAICQYCEMTFHRKICLIGFKRCHFHLRPHFLIL